MNGKSRLQQAQEDAEEVKDIMLDNLNKAEERSGKLGDLDKRGDELRRKAKTFEKIARKPNKKRIWKNKTMKIVLITVAVVVALIVVGLIIYYTTLAWIGESDTVGLHNLNVDSDKKNKKSRSLPEW
ncbi:vesicle-associated membrane protein 5 [Syngnathus typhle]